MAVEITLGGVTLNKHIVWENRHEKTNVKQVVKETLGGGLRIFAAASTAGEIIHLQSQESGWLTRAQIEQLEAIAKVPEAVYELVIGTDVHQVMFAHHLGAPVAYKPIAFRMVGDSTDYFKGDIYLIKL